MTKQTKRHGLFIGIERVGKTFFLSFKAVGKLSHEDYVKITPMIDAALEAVKDPRIKCLADLTELEGWELRAAWDDFKIGLKHGSEFEQVAIVGNKRWEEFSAKVATWIMSADIKYFEDADSALAWLDA